MIVGANGDNPRRTTQPQAITWHPAENIMVRVLWPSTRLAASTWRSWHSNGWWLRVYKEAVINSRHGILFDMMAHQHSFGSFLGRCRIQCGVGNVNKRRYIDVCQHLDVFRRHVYLAVMMFTYVNCRWRIVDEKRFPQWRQQNGSGLPDRSPVCLNYIANRRPFQNRPVNNRDMSNFRKFSNYRLARFFTHPHWTRLGQSESIEKSSLRLTIVYGVTTSGLQSIS